MYPVNSTRRVNLILNIWLQLWIHLISKFTSQTIGWNCNAGFGLFVRPLEPSKIDKIFIISFITKNKLINWNVKFVTFGFISLVLLHSWTKLTANWSKMCVRSGLWPYTEAVRMCAHTQKLSECVFCENGKLFCVNAMERVKRKHSSRFTLEFLENI